MGGKQALSGERGLPAFFEILLEAQREIPADRKGKGGRLFLLLWDHGRKKPELGEQLEDILEIGLKEGILMQ